MAQKLSDNIVKIGVAVIIAAVTYFGRMVAQDHDTITGMAATLPAINETVKEISKHPCNCGGYARMQHTRE